MNNLSLRLQTTTAADLQRRHNEGVATVRAKLKRELITEKGIEPLANLAYHLIHAVRTDSILTARTTLMDIAGKIKEEPHRFLPNDVLSGPVIASLQGDADDGHQMKGRIGIFTTKGLTRLMQQSLQMREKTVIEAVLKLTSPSEKERQKVTSAVMRRFIQDEYGPKEVVREDVLRPMTSLLQRLTRITEEKSSLMAWKKRNRLIADFKRTPERFISPRADRARALTTLQNYLSQEQVRKFLSTSRKEYVAQFLMEIATDVSTNAYLQ